MTFQPESTDRLAALDRYADLRHWALALVDIIEVAGRTLVKTAGLLRDLLEQMDSRIEVIGNLPR